MFEVTPKRGIQTKQAETKEGLDPKRLADINGWQKLNIMTEVGWECTGQRARGDRECKLALAPKLLVRKGTRGDLGCVCVYELEKEEEG